MSVVISNSINAPLPLAASLGGTGITSPSVNQIPVTNDSSPFNLISLSDGQMVMGVTSGSPIAGNLVAGNGINLNFSSPNLTISGVGTLRGITYLTTATSGTYTTPAGVTHLYVIVIGAGGGGGGAATNGAGSGGGGGGYAASYLAASASYSYTVGAGGPGGAAGGNNSGSAGYPSSFGSITANGGSGGQGSTSVAGGSGGCSGDPGSGGNGVSGNFLFYGGSGGIGISLPLSPSTNVALPGFGGSSFFGGSAPTVPFTGGGIGFPYGGGGAGGGTNDAGDGYHGVIIVYEYY